MLKLCILLSLITSNLCQAVIYGTDDRVSAYEINDEKILAIKGATAALVAKKKLAPYKVFGGYRIPMKGFGLCSDQKFAHTTALSNCSGTLIAPNVILTAAHCAQAAINPDTEDTFVDWVWVFDYEEEQGQGDIFIPDSSVVEIKKLGGLDNTGVTDYSFFEIKEKQKREPAPFKLPGFPLRTQNLYMLGHPSGMPKVLTSQGRKIDVGNIPVNPKLMITNLDAFGGNSGSAVFSTDTHEIQGILIQGRDDYKKRAGANCKEVRTCPEKGCGWLKVDGKEVIPPGETVYQIDAIRFITEYAYLLNFRQNFSFSLEANLERYIKRALIWMSFNKEYMADMSGKFFFRHIIEKNHGPLIEFLIEEKSVLYKMYKDDKRFFHFLKDNNKTELAKKIYASIESHLSADEKKLIQSLL